jgi:hypothetical protein
MAENYRTLALTFLEKYSVRNFFLNTNYRKGISLSPRSKLNSENLATLRTQLQQQDVNYMLDGFLMDLALSSKSSREEKIGLIQLMQTEDEIACGLKALERRADFLQEDITKLVDEKNLSAQTRLIYHLPAK